jgi:hypothetical protein
MTPSRKFDMVRAPPTLPERVDRHAMVTVHAKSTLAIAKN